MFSRIAKSAFFLLAGFLCFAPHLLNAQSAQAPGSPTRVPDGGAREQLVSIFVSSLPNVPFTATLSTEWVRTYSDGTTVTLKSRRLIARDARGRVFQERRLLVPEDGKNESVILRTEISDPQQHTVYFCMERERACEIRGFTPLDQLGPAAGYSEQTGGGARDLQSLGKQTVLGVETEGWQGSTVIPAHTIGNDGPILSKREYWYSPQLGFNLRSMRQDPRFGLEKFEVTELALGEPDAKLFEPTSGFAIVDARRMQPGKQPEPSN